MVVYIYSYIAKTCIQMFQEKDKMISELQDKQSVLSKEKENRDALASKIKVRGRYLFKGRLSMLKICFLILIGKE